MTAPPPPDRLTRFALAVGRLIPDATTTAVVMMVVVALAAITLGHSAAETADGFYRGLWMLLPFTMQMTLILVLSASLGSSPFFKRLVARVAAVPRTRAQVFGVAVFVTGGLSYLYWGLGFALGPLTAIYLAREAESRGIAVDFPFLLATTGAATSVWQFGLSASAPILMNTPGHFLEKTTGIMPLSTTIWAPASIVFEIAFVVALLLVARLIHPKAPTPVSAFPDAFKLAEPIQAAAAEPNDLAAAAAMETPSERLERSSVPALLLVGALLVWLHQHFVVKDLGLDFNSLNTIILAACLLAHRNVRNFSLSLRSAIVSCWPIVVLYHVYAGVAGLIQFTPVGEAFATALAEVSTRYTFPLLTALAATFVALFVPSSGGQWVIQGFVTAKAAEAVGVTAQRGLLALSIGDQMGNLISPFWAVIMAGVARVDFRRFIGYSMVFSALWFVLGVIIFTFLPA